MRKESLKLPEKQSWFLLFPLLFWLVPTTWLERGPSLCLVRRIFGIRCPGCGMLRALSYLAHGDVRAAWRHNRLVMLVAPLLGYAWGKSLLRLYRPHPVAAPTYRNRNTL